MRCHIFAMSESIAFHACGVHRRVSVVSCMTPSVLKSSLCSRRRVIPWILFLPYITRCAALARVASAAAGVRVADPETVRHEVTDVSGLRYYDFVIGDGDQEVLPNSQQTVVLHYTLGTTGARNGWKIDSTYDREPFVFTIGNNEVVKGLEQAVIGMRVHGRRRCLVPPQLGYHTSADRPVPSGFAEYQRFKNLYLNNDRQYKPEVVFDIELLRIRHNK